MRRLSHQSLVITAGLLLISLAAGGCATSSQAIPLSKAVAARGQELATAALSAYDSIDDAATRDQQNQLTLKALTLPAGVPLGGVTRQDFSAQLNPRRKAYRALKGAYGQFQVLADTNAGPDLSAATGGLIDAVNGLATLPDVSSQTKNILSTAAQQLATAQQQRSLRKYNAALAKIAEGYQAVWNEDLPTWKTALTGFTVAYTSGIEGLPVTLFDGVLVQKAIEQPFAAPVAARLYQVKLISAAQSDHAATVAGLNKVAKAFDGLVAAHVALDANKPSPQDVLAAANQVIDAITKE